MALRDISLHMKNTPFGHKTPFLTKNVSRFFGNFYPGRSTASPVDPSLFPDSMGPKLVRAFLDTRITHFSKNGLTRFAPCERKISHLTMRSDPFMGPQGESKGQKNTKTQSPDVRQHALKISDKTAYKRQSYSFGHFGQNRLF